MTKEELEKLTGVSDRNELKKAYLDLVKKYHPDRAPEGLKTQYNEYLALINRLYGELKTQAEIKKQAETAVTETIREYTIKYRGAVITTKDWEDVLLKTGHEMIEKAYSMLRRLHGFAVPDEEVAESQILCNKATAQFQKVLKESRNSYYRQIADQMMIYYVQEYNLYLAKYYSSENSK